MAAGWTKTSDTGQINNTTVTKPGGSNTSQGYEIYRNSSSDIYFKIEYGSGNGGATCPGIWLTPGTGSNGSGTITGPGSNTLNRAQLGSNFQGQVAGGTLPSYCSGDGTYLNILSNVDTTGFTSNYPQSLWGFMIDKIRDATGTATGEGFAIYGFNGQDSNTRFWTVVGNAVYANNQGNNSSIFADLTSTINGSWTSGGGVRNYGGNEMVMPLIIGAGQVRFLKCGVLYCQSDFGSMNGTTFTATNLGGSHTYLALPIITMYAQGLSSTWRAPGYASSTNWAYLWE